MPFKICSAGGLETHGIPPILKKPATTTEFFGENTLESRQKLKKTVPGEIVVMPR
jgi:hypothetical protein